LPVKQLLKHNGNGMFVTLASWLAQLMPLPLEKGPLNGCVCVCVCKDNNNNNNNDRLTAFDPGQPG